MQPLEIRAGIGAQLVGEDLLGLRVGLQRLGRAALLQGTHELVPEPLPQGMPGRELAQLGDHFRCATTVDPGLHPQLKGVKPQFLEPGRLGRDHRPGRHVGQCRATPQRQGLAEQFRGPLAVSLVKHRPGFGDQPLELGDVQLRPRHEQPVSGCSGHQDPPIRVTDQLPQPGHVSADQLARAGRRIIPPELVRELCRWRLPARDVGAASPAGLATWARRSGPSYRPPEPQAAPAVDKT